MFSFSSNFGKIAILFFLFTLPASAEIDHRKLKGIQKLTRPEYQFLSPVYGFGVLKKGILENLYFYGPQEDKTVQLIRLMFHSVDQITFVATHLPTKVATYLDTYAIGVLLRLSLNLSDESSHQDHESRFLKAIHKAIGLDDEELTRERFKGKERQLLRKGSKEFVATLLGAFDETLGPSRKYPAHFVEHVLLGLFWKKAKNEKSEFIHLLAEIPQALAYEKEDFLFNSGWSEDNYTVDDYNENVSKYKKLNFPTLATSPLLNNPEVAAYLAYSYKVWDNFLPPIFEYENAELTLDDGTVEDFYDCGETSVRNFLNIVLKNSETQSLDTRFLRAPADAWNLTISPALLDFYERNSSLSGFGSAELHHQWAKVVSQLPGVSYRQPSGKPVCNITNGFKSIMKVFENLIFSTDRKFATLPAEKQLDQIIQFFSRPDFELSWDLVDMNREEISLNVGFEVRFFINQLPCFTWKFNPGHFIVSPISSTRSDWRKELSIILANEYSEMLTAKADQGSGSFTHLTQVSWFVFEETLGSVISKLKNSLLSNSELQYLFWSIPLKANQAKLYAIQTVISNRWDSLYPTSIKLMHEIPSDLNNYSFVLDLAFENHNNEEVKNITESYLEVIFGKISSNEDLRSTLLSHCINKKQKVNINAFLQKYGRELVNKRSNIASVVGPLHEAVSTEDVEIVKLFLEAGADPNLKDYFGTTPLHYGALLDNFETIVPEILRAGGNIDAQDNSGKTILHYAVESRDLRRVKFVVSQGANLNLESETSATPLDLALRFGNQETVEYLRSRNAIQSSPVWVPGLRFFNSILSYFKSAAG